MKFIFSFFLIILMTGCRGGKGDRQASSTGQPYEVVVEGDTDSIVTKILSEDVPALPQPEPLCNVINVKKGKVKGSYQMVRTRIVVDINPRYKAFSAKTTQDEDASPQLVIRIKAKSMEQLRATFYNKSGEPNKSGELSKNGEPNKSGELSKKEEPNKNAELLRSIINQSELKHLVSVIKQNPEKQRVVKRMFGLNMKIPASMDASKKVKGFLWLSNNASSGMQNLVIFRLKGSGCTEPEAWTYSKDEINKVLRRNILGETDNMYMRLDGEKKMRLRGEGNMRLDGESHPNKEPEKDLDLLPMERGLWDMKGDAMGGPYLMKVLPMSKGKIVTPRSYYRQPTRIDSRIVVIAFVYAPEMKKRNLTKQLEATLSTINPD